MISDVSTIQTEFVSNSIVLSLLVGHRTFYNRALILYTNHYKTTYVVIIQINKRLTYHYNNRIEEKLLNFTQSTQTLNCFMWQIACHNPNNLTTISMHTCMYSVCNALTGSLDMKLYTRYFRLTVSLLHMCCYYRLHNYSIFKLRFICNFLTKPSCRPYLN